MISIGVVWSQFNSNPASIYERVCLSSWVGLGVIVAGNPRCFFKDRSDQTQFPETLFQLKSRDSTAKLQFSVTDGQFLLANTYPGLDFSCILLSSARLVKVILSQPQCFSILQDSTRQKTRRHVWLGYSHLANITCPVIPCPWEIVNK